MPVLIERERKTKEQLKAVFAYIRRKRDKEQQALAEIRAREEEEKKRKREEEKKKETVEDVKKEIEKCEAKLEELKQEKHSLFQQFKKVLNEEDTKRQQERAAAAALAAQHHTPPMHMHEARPLGENVPNQFEKNQRRNSTSMLSSGPGHGRSMLHTQQVPHTHPPQQQLRPYLYSAPTLTTYRGSKPTQDQLQQTDQHDNPYHHSQSFSEDPHKSSKYTSAMGQQGSTSEQDPHHKRQVSPQHRSSQQQMDPQPYHHQLQGQSQQQQVTPQPPEQQQQAQEQQQKQLVYQLAQAQQHGYSEEQLKFIQQIQQSQQEQGQQRYPVQQDPQQSGQPYQPQGAQHLQQQQQQQQQQQNKQFQLHQQQPYHLQSQDQMYQQPQQSSYPVQQSYPPHASGSYQVQHGYTVVLDNIQQQQQPTSMQHYSSSQQQPALQMGQVQGQQHEQGNSQKIGLLPTPRASVQDSSQRPAGHGQQHGAVEEKQVHSDRGKDKRGQSSKRSGHKYSPYPSAKVHHQGSTPKKHVGRHLGSQEGPSDRYKIKHSQEGSSSSERHTGKYASEGSSSSIEKYAGKHLASQEGSAESTEHSSSYSRHHHHHQSKGHKGSTFSQQRQRYYP